MMRVRINGNVYTLITIVPDIWPEKNSFGILAATTIAVAYVFDKERKVFRFPAKDIEEIEK